MLLVLFHPLCCIGNDLGYTAKLFISREIGKSCKGIGMFTEALPVVMERSRLTTKLWNLGHLRLVTVDYGNTGYHTRLS